MASHLINAIKQKFDTTVQSDWGTQWENENPLANGMWRTEEKRPAALSFFLQYLVVNLCLLFKTSTTNWHYFYGFYINWTIWLAEPDSVGITCIPNKSANTDSFFFCRPHSWKHWLSLKNGCFYCPLKLNAL